MTNKIKFYYPLFVASFSFFLSYFTRLTWSILSVYVPFHPTVIQDAHVFAIYFFGYIVIQIPAGFIADKYSCGKIISISMIVLAFATFLSGIADNIFKEYIASFIMGVSAGFVYPASLKIVNFYYRKNKSLYIGYYSIAWPLAIVAAGVFLPPIAIYIGWRWGYYFSAILSLIFAFLSYPLDTQPTEQKKLNISLLKDKKVMLISIGGFLFFLSYWSITLYAYKYFTQIGINKTLAGYIFSTMAIAGLFSSSISGPLIKKFGLKFTMIITLMLYALFIISFSFTNSYFILMILAFSMGFMRFIITPGNNNMLVAIGKDNVGVVTGISNMIWQSSGIVGPLVSSFLIHTFGFSFFWIAIGIIVLISSLFYKAIKI